MVSDRQARIALTTIFVTSGVFLGSWSARIPAVKSELHLSSARLGLILACSILGSISASPPAGFLSARFGSRRVLRFSAPFGAAAFAFVALAPSAPSLAVALFCWGFASGVVNVSMNTQAIALEARYRRTILSTMHGGFSIGMMAGALLAFLVVYLNVSYRAHLLVVALVLLVAAVAIGFFLIETERGTHSRASHRRIGFSMALMVIAAVLFFDTFCEGAASSWSALYSKSAGSSAAVAALPLGLYSLMMAIGRFRGDRLVMRMGVGGLVRAGSVAAFCGLGLALAFPTPVVVLIGFGLFGIGLSCQAPTLYRAAGQLSLPEGQGLATALLAAWPAALLVGPLIGGLSSLISLRGALLVALVAAIAMTSLSAALGRLAPLPMGEESPTIEPEYPL